jgi:hypothetical protein
MAARRKRRSTRAGGRRKTARKAYAPKRRARRNAPTKRRTIRRRRRAPVVSRRRRSSRRNQPMNPLIQAGGAGAISALVDGYVVGMLPAMIKPYGSLGIHLGLGWWLSMPRAMGGRWKIAGVSLFAIGIANIVKNFLPGGMATSSNSWVDPQTVSQAWVPASAIASPQVGVTAADIPVQSFLSRISVPT